ncbi:Phosphoglucomutase-1 [Stylosanthes scabra]|uniref:Phosphoglucomutase-1 n=1 Tax=Stylosanthes scabra TaxID=79078 RepID=A0ABU6SVZ6_9FABA|nr:Phosphoglucomutase-1 [Stylosanthes scabra]
MILGKRFFVTPSDSVAIIAANAVEAIPYFSSGLEGVARSMPTSAALDVVAKHLNLKFFEVPTGWKFFGTLMDAGYVQSVVKKVLELVRTIFVRKMESGQFWHVEDIVCNHWATYGRHYYTRYDYENEDAGAAKEQMANLVKLQSSLPEVNKIVKGVRSDVANVVNADEFEYKDPVDGSVSSHQGIRYLFEDGSRLLYFPEAHKLLYFSNCAWPTRRWLGRNGDAQTATISLVPGAKWGKQTRWRLERGGIISLVALAHFRPSC